LAARLHWPLTPNDGPQIAGSIVIEEMEDLQPGAELRWLMRSDRTTRTNRQKVVGAQVFAVLAVIWAKLAVGLLHRGCGIPGHRTARRAI
jgi:hypothetical protein